MRLFQTFAADSAKFDDDNLVSVAGLKQALTMAEQTRLTSMFANKVGVAAPADHIGQPTRRRGVTGQPLPPIPMHRIHISVTGSRFDMTIPANL